MRLVSYPTRGGARAGVQRTDGVIDAGAVLGDREARLRELIAGAVSRSSAS